MAETKYKTVVKWPILNNIWNVTQDDWVEFHYNSTIIPL